MTVRFKSILYAELNKNFIRRAYAVKNFFDDSVLVVLRVNFEAVILQTFFIFEPRSRLVLKFHARAEITLSKI